MFVLILVGALASTQAFMPRLLKNLSSSFCTDSEFLCNTNECIPLAKQCDGHNDCKDSSDEKDCELIRCLQPHYFRCENSRCISSAFVCDSENDCEDFSDEKNCEDFKKNFQINATCGSHQWQCTDKLCIPKEWVCNGESDCMDGSDEVIGCSKSIRCDGFRCKNRHCIPSEWRCDGQDDCRDNSDEEGCDILVDPKNCTTENEHFLCGDGKTCLNLDQACDNVSQCSDKSDEGPLCKNVCGNCAHKCVHLPTGPRCMCPKGYHTIDEGHCEEKNECEIFGICDQKCKNLPGSFECFCDEGYILQDDKRSCLALSGEATMFFSSKKDIRAYSLRSELYFPVVRNLKQVVGVDFDGTHVYWTDIFSEHESIARCLKNGKEKELLVTAGLGAPEDLRVDYITKNIYFTDAERQHIGVCTNDGLHCTIIVNKDIHKPRGIVLNQLKGEMYWSDWGDRPEIGRACMDGSKDVSFVSSDIKWPNGLAIDCPNERLYWTDAKLLTLESIKLDGTDRRVILEGIVRHPYAIAVFENRLYWSDWSTNSIQSCDKFTGKNHHTIIKAQDYIYGISIYHPNLHKLSQKNPCGLAGCSDICLLSGPSTYTCACPQDKQLGVDGHTCKDIEKRQKLILATDNQLMEVQHQALGKHEVFALSAPVKKIGALAYNSVIHVLYVSDLEIRRIVEMNLHTGFSKLLDISELGLITSMDYDYLGNNLYLCDTERNTLEVVNLNTMSRTILLRDLNGESPQSIALVPEEGVMFVAFYRPNNRASHVDRLFMDGTSRTHPMDQGLLGPITLAYDSQLHRVFVADAGTGNIESTSVEGDDRHGFRSLLEPPVGITSLKTDVFWVTRHSRKLFWANKYNVANFDYNRKITLDLPQTSSKMRILSVTPRTTGLSPCQTNNGGCSHLCLQSQNRIVCACPVDMVLDNDNKTCTRRVRCAEFFCTKSNTCIPNKFRCDGAKHCPNGEDEDDCKKRNHCTMDHFQCDDGECILKANQCDHHYDCRDKSDEHNCDHVENAECPPNHFKCKLGECINDRFVCDGVPDCADAEDENNCAVSVCDNQSFRCKSGTCIPKNWECDREFDCPDNSDEHSDCVKCLPSDFSCTNGKCLNKTLVCNGENNCGDNSDETSCEKPHERCDIDEFLCSAFTHVCVPHAARCNGTSECPHQEDEEDCGSNCLSDEFTCKNKRCIPKQWRCDRTDDCEDNSDEDPAICGEAKPTLHEMAKSCDKFQCKNGNCIDFALVCNGESNCFDGSDEEGACNTSCNALNNPCDHVCIKTPTGPVCKCKNGFELQGNGYSCEDIDECNKHPPICSQICRNTHGKFMCDCYNGFSLKNDRTTCKSNGRAMSLLYTFDNQIRELSQTDNSLEIAYTEETLKFTSLEVSVKANSILLTLENSRVILMVDRSASTRMYLEDVGQPQKLALDWLTDNIYYVNSEPHAQSISVCNFNDKTCSNLIPIDHNHQVSALAVDAGNKFLFYSLTSWWLFSSLNYVIYKTNLDGTEPEELVKGSGYITGLAFDLYKKQLYFVDQQRSELHSVAYDGTHNIVLASNLSRPSGLRFFENRVFFLTPNSFGKCSLYEPITCDFFRPDDISTSLFAIMQDTVQPQIEDNPCVNHTCTHLCVAAKLRYKCLCEDGNAVEAGEECSQKTREAETDDDRRKRVTSYYSRHRSESNSASIVAAVMVSLCLLSIGVVVYYVIKRRNSGSFNIRMRVRRRGDCLIKEDSPVHEFVNAVDSHDPKSAVFVHV